jgi:hypothetical protein
MSILYDPRYHTFESWASLLVEQYAAQQLSIPDDRTDWRDWARGLKAIDVFTNEAIPGPDGFENWDDWAQQLINSVNPAA